MGKWDDEEAWSDEEVKPVAKAKAKPAAGKAKPAAAKAKPAASKPAAGMDDDDWSDEESGGGYPAKKEAAAPKAKAKAAAATPAPKPAEAAPKAKAAAPAPAAPAPGKKKNKFADKEVVGSGDLFDGFAVEKKEETVATPAAASSASAVKSEAKVVNKNSMEALTLNLQQDVDKLVKMVTPKVLKAEAKKAPNKFFTDTFRALEGKLSLQEMEQLQKQFKDIHNKRLKQKQEEEKAKKAAEEEKEKEEKKKKDEEFRAQGLMTDEDYFKDMM